MALRVLLADESSTIKKVIQLALQDFAVEVKTVHMGVDVLEVARQFKPDIILADVLLQKKNGYDVCEEIKQNPATSLTPVILMWSSFMEVDHDRLNHCGADGQLEKPFDVDDLRQLVTQLVPVVQDQPIAPYTHFSPQLNAEFKLELENDPRLHAAPPTQNAPGQNASGQNAAAQHAPIRQNPVRQNPVEPKSQAQPNQPVPSDKKSWSMDDFEDVSSFEPSLSGVASEAISEQNRMQSAPPANSFTPSQAPSQPLSQAPSQAVQRPKFPPNTTPATARSPLSSSFTADSAPENQPLELKSDEILPSFEFTSDLDSNDSQSFRTAVPSSPQSPLDRFKISSFDDQDEDFILADFNKSEGDLVYPKDDFRVSSHQPLKPTSPEKISPAPGSFQSPSPSTVSMDAIQSLIQQQLEQTLPQIVEESLRKMLPDLISSIITREIEKVSQELAQIK